MSIVSSYISSRAPVFRINVQASTFMDHVLAIVAGLGLRIIIDLVGYEDHKLTGSLVGLWEGVVVQHFIKKSPKSFDPYVAYGLRVFIDFLFMESLIRLVLTFLFTGMGIVLADVGPRVWVDTGLRRFWRHLRRDLYIFLHSLPSIPYSSRPRTVRFSPSRAPSVITSVPPSLSVITTTTQAPPAPVLRKRPVPGSFPDYVSETDTDLSVRSPGLDYSALVGHTPDRRPTVQTESETSYDPDEGNRSSSDSETHTPVLTEAELSNLPDIEDEDVAREIVLENHKDEITPRQLPIKLPPTPSDTTYPVRLDESHEVPPPSAGLPQIPDDDEDWENISRREPTLLSSYEDKSTSPFPAQLPLSSPPVGRELPSSTTLVGAQPDARLPGTLELDPSAHQSHTPAEEGPATISAGVVTSPHASVDDNRPSDLLVDLNNSGPATQAHNSRMPSHTQLDPPLWGLNTPSANIGKNLDLWGDNQGDIIAKAKDNEFDAGTGPNDPSEEFHNSIPFTVERNDQERQSERPPNMDVPAVPTTEDPFTNMSASQPDNTRSEPSATQPEDQDPTSFAPRLGATTSQQPGDTGSTPTDTDSSNTQEDDPTSEVPAEALSSSDEETSENKNESSVAGGENIEATLSVIVEEPYPEKNSERLDKALQLRKQIVQIEKDILTLKRGRAWSAASVSKDDLEAEVRAKEEHRDALNTKARRWYAIASDGKDEDPPNKVDLSTQPAEQFKVDVQMIIVRCLLRNIQKLIIVLGPGKARKQALTARLDALDLFGPIYRVGSNAITLTLPTSSS